MQADVKRLLLPDFSGAVAVGRLLAGCSPA
jgi:hypothetical protein